MIGELDFIKKVVPYKDKGVKFKCSTCSNRSNFWTDNIWCKTCGDRKFAW